MVFSMPVITEIDDSDYWYTVLEETVLPLFEGAPFIFIIKLWNKSKKELPEWQLFFVLFYGITLTEITLYHLSLKN